MPFPCGAEQARRAAGRTKAHALAADSLWTGCATPSGPAPMPSVATPEARSGTLESGKVGWRQGWGLWLYACDALHPWRWNTTAAHRSGCRPSTRRRIGRSSGATGDEERSPDYFSRLLPSLSFCRPRLAVCHRGNPGCFCQILVCSTEFPGGPPKARRAEGPFRPEKALRAPGGPSWKSRRTG